MPTLGDLRWEVKQPRYEAHLHDSKGASDEYELEGANAGRSSTEPSDGHIVE